MTKKKHRFNDCESLKKHNKPCVHLSCEMDDQEMPCPFTAKLCAFKYQEQLYEEKLVLTHKVVIKYKEHHN